MIELRAWSWVRGHAWTSFSSMWKTAEDWTERELKTTRTLLPPAGNMRCSTPPEHGSTAWALIFLPFVFSFLNAIQDLMMSRTAIWKSRSRSVYACESDLNYSKTSESSSAHSGWWYESYKRSQRDELEAAGSLQGLENEGLWVRSQDHRHLCGEARWRRRHEVELLLR